MPHFPQELVTAFIESLIVDTTYTLQMTPLIFTTLLSCALVSESFSTPARKHLFSKISLLPHPSFHASKKKKGPCSPDYVVRRMMTLAELLANEKSDLGCLITSLRIEVNNNRAILGDSSIRTVLRLLLSTACNLKSFQLEGPETIYPPLSWTTIGTDVSELLTAICHSPSIKSLHFGHLVGIPAELMLGNPCANALFLVQTSFSVSSDLSSFSSLEAATPTPLTHLNIGFYLEEFWNCFSAVDRIFSNLKAFGLSIENQTVATQFKTIMRRLPQTLNELDLVFWGKAFEVLSQSLEVHTLRFLRKITFGLVPGSEWQPTPSTDVPPRRWLTFLNDIDLPNQIETIIIFVRLTLSPEEILRFQTLIDFLGEPAQAGISIFNTEKFPEMKRIWFYVYICIPENLASQVTTFNSEESQRNIEARMFSLINPPKDGAIEVTIICNIL